MWTGELEPDMYTEIEELEKRIQEFETERNAMIELLVTALQANPWLGKYAFWPTDCYCTYCGVEGDSEHKRDCLLNRIETFFEAHNIPLPDSEARRKQQMQQDINSFLAIYPNAEWGPGHIVLSDDNFDEHHIKWCLDEGEKSLRLSPKDLREKYPNCARGDIISTLKFLGQFLVDYYAD
jgi:hypothetical protein